MSALVDAVLAGISRKGFADITSSQVEAILSGAGIEAGAAAGVPVRLRVERIQFSGRKVLTGVGDGIPFEFDWAVPNAVIGIGSGANFRGKTSVLLVVQWALTGRCNLQDNVRSWIELVNVRLRLDNTVIDVSFNHHAGVPIGEVVLVAGTGNLERRTPLGTFDSDQSFEALMGALMLTRLRLDVISMWSDKSKDETSHRWPAYAAALTVRADVLDPILGNEGVLATRMLQMFVGTSWATSLAQAATASRALEYQAAEALSKLEAAEDASASTRSAAQERVTTARAHYDSFGDEFPDVAQMLEFAAQIQELTLETHKVELKLADTKASASLISEQVKAEKAIRHQQIEDTLAHLFFNSMEPTVCPRCAAAITEERRKAEPEDHTCSLCAHDLDLAALKGNVVVATSVPNSTRESLVAAVSATEEEMAGSDTSEDPTVEDALQALLKASVEAEAAVNAIGQELSQLIERRNVLIERSKGRSDQIEAAKKRQAAAMELARAEGALESLLGPAVVEVLEGPDKLAVAVVNAAHAVLKKWLKEEQDPRLDAISIDIAGLARSFGSDNIDSVRLLGNCNMQIVRGGVTSGYGGLTNGEKLRLKLATTIALIKYGYEQGVGRHPGILFIDSPAAEEIPEKNLEKILTALREISNATGIQVFVATRYGNVLTSVLPKDHLKVAEGDDPVW